MIQMKIGRSETGELFQLLEKLIVPGKKISNQAANCWNENKKEVGSKVLEAEGPPPE